MGLPSPGLPHPEPHRPPQCQLLLGQRKAMEATAIGGQAWAWEHPEAAQGQAPGAPTVCWSLLGTVYTTLSPRGQ